MKTALRQQLLTWMDGTNDPRFEDPKSTFWDQVRYTPDYQMKDSDWKKRIEDYRICPPFGSVREIECLTSQK
jgi:hypothetical protein